VRLSEKASDDLRGAQRIVLPCQEDRIVEPFAAFDKSRDSLERRLHVTEASPMAGMTFKECHVMNVLGTVTHVTKRSLVRFRIDMYDESGATVVEPS
jgi:hypothetical protein